MNEDRPTTTFWLSHTDYRLIDRLRFAVEKPLNSVNQYQARQCSRAIRKNDL